MHWRSCLKNTSLQAYTYRYILWFLLYGWVWEMVASHCKFTGSWQMKMHPLLTFETSSGLTVVYLDICCQGVQAQTVANFSLALESDLTIIPVLNKIDLKSAQPEVVAQQMHSVFGINTDQILQVSHTSSLLLLHLCRQPTSLWI